MSFLPMPSYSERDRKFLEECAKLVDVNGAVIVSRGDVDECDYDELTDGQISDEMSISTKSLGWVNR